MNDKYILDEKGNPKEEKDLLTWGKWFETADRIIAKTKIGKSEISTVFLGLDHSFGGNKPLLFETMVFGGTLDGEQNRYSTREESIKGHEEMVKKVENDILVSKQAYNGGE